MENREHWGEPGHIGRFSHQKLIQWAEKYGSPLFVYDGDRIRYKVRYLKNAFMGKYGKLRVHYALKANSNMSIIKILKSEGLAAECISLGEMKLALKLGYKGEEILFTSSSKSMEELRFAAEIGAIINLDSMGDFENLAFVLDSLKRHVMVSFRVNPDVDPKTHRHIATGHKFTKFGILLESEKILMAYQSVLDNPWMTPVGIHSHVGSQITDPEPMKNNVDLLIDAVCDLKKKLNLDLRFIDVGGGLGIPYQPGQKELDLDAIADEVTQRFKSRFEGVMPLPELWMEPGRFFVGDAGFLITQVNSVKHTPHTNFINVNTGFNHQVRPLLYEAYHDMVVLNRQGKPQLYDVAGNICETGDILGEERLLPTPQRGDYLAIMNSGAYGFSMASEYNSFLLPAELLVLGQTEYLIRKRESFEDLLRNQIMPDVLKGKENE